MLLDLSPPAFGIPLSESHHPVRLGCMRLFGICTKVQCVQSERAAAIDVYAKPRFAPLGDKITGSSIKMTLFPPVRERVCGGMRLLLILFFLVGNGFGQIGRFVSHLLEISIVHVENPRVVLLGLMLVNLAF